MIVWGDMRQIREQVAKVPEGRLRKWIAKHPEHVRKFSGARNGTLLIRSEAVVRAVEDGTI
jgi:predicted DCC family thiol-disulfide oxidoreductase YuxK